MATRGELGRLFGLPRFRTLYASRLTSQASDGVFQASLVSYVLFSPERATSPGAIAASLAVVLLPFSVVGPFTGIILDRVPRQRALVVSSTLRAALLAVLVVLIAAGHTGVDFYVVALGVFSVSRFVNSALSACLPVVVPPGEDALLVTANALSTTSGTVATMLGAGLGSGLRGLLGGDDADVAVVAALAAGCYLVAAFTAARARRGDFGPVTPAAWNGALGQAREVVVELVAGAKHLVARAPARDALAALTAFRAFYGLLFVGSVLLYRNSFHGPLGGLGGLAAVVAGTGVGTVAAAVVTPRATRRVTKQAWVTGTVLAAGVGVVAFGLPLSPAWFLVAGPVLGFTSTGSKICVDTFVQEETDDQFRGRAFSLYDLLFNLAYVAAAAIGALTLPESGRSRLMIVVVGAGFALTALLYHRAARRHRRDHPAPPRRPDLVTSAGGGGHAPATNS